MSLLLIEANDGKRTGFRPAVGHFNRLVKKSKKTETNENYCNFHYIYFYLFVATRLLVAIATCILILFI